MLFPHEYFHPKILVAQTYAKITLPQSILGSNCSAVHDQHISQFWYCLLENFGLHHLNAIYTVLYIDIFYGSQKVKLYKNVSRYQYFDIAIFFGPLVYMRTKGREKISTIIPSNKGCSEEDKIVQKRVEPPLKPFL